MVDEFERTMDLIFDRMEDNIRNHAVAETEARQKIATMLDGLQVRDATLRTLQADLVKAHRDLESAKHKMGFLEAQLASRDVDSSKLSELWQAADDMLKITKDIKAINPETRDRLTKALHEAYLACDQVPF